MTPFISQYYNLSTLLLIQSESFCKLGWPASKSLPILSIPTHNPSQIFTVLTLQSSSISKTDILPHFSRESPPSPSSLSIPLCPLAYLFSIILDSSLTHLLNYPSSCIVASMFYHLALFGRTFCGINLSFFLCLTPPTSISRGLPSYRSSLKLAPMLLLFCPPQSYPFSHCIFFYVISIALSHPHFSTPLPIHHVSLPPSSRSSFLINTKHIFSNKGHFQQQRPSSATKAILSDKGHLQQQSGYGSTRNNL